MRIIEHSIEDCENDGCFVRLAFPLDFHLTLAAAGDMGPSGLPVHASRRRLLKLVGVDPDRVAMVSQVHSRAVVDIEQAMQNTDVSGDGIVAAGDWIPGGYGSWGAGVTVADCMPIGVYEHESGSWAVLHSGREGTGILESAVRTIRHRIGTAGRFSVTLGPCISVGRYPVDRETATLFADRWGTGTVQAIPEGAAIDLRAANIRCADRVGVARVELYTDCTASNPQLCSYRRDGKEQFQRMLALITRM